MELKYKQMNDDNNRLQSFNRTFMELKSTIPLSIVGVSEF